MQNTRLTILFDRLFAQFSLWLRNPWRRLSLLAISLLFGNFLATTLSTVAGQEADLDVVVSLFLVFLTETISWLVYRHKWQRSSDPTLQARPLLIEILNGIKIGNMYGLFVEAFKLGS